MCASDAERLFAVFDTSGDGQISFDEFLTALCRELNPLRKRLVNEAFDKLAGKTLGKKEATQIVNKHLVSIFIFNFLKLYVKYVPYTR